MRRSVEWGLAVAALLLTAVFMAGASRWGRSLFAGGNPPLPADPYYHAGKVPRLSFEEGGCRGPKCHPGFPHVKVSTQAAFRNMHVRFVDCLACHGTDARKSWIVKPAAAGPRGGGSGALLTRWRIAAPDAGVAPEKPHGRLGRPALSCRSCHSEEGFRELGAKGFTDLSAGFANPVPLRMIEEGAKQWTPATIR